MFVGYRAVLVGFVIVQKTAVRFGRRFAHFYNKKSIKRAIKCYNMLKLDVKYAILYKNKTHAAILP